jgi:hypothetical protein
VIVVYTLQQLEIRCDKVTRNPVGALEENTAAHYAKFMGSLILGAIRVRSAQGLINLGKRCGRDVAMLPTLATRIMGPEE